MRSRIEDLQLFIAQAIGVVLCRPLHRCNAKHLKQVALEHVAQHAAALVERPAPADGHRLRGGDLHVLDEAAIPHWFEQCVGKAENQQILHGLLAQVMIDAKELIFTEVAVRSLI